MDDVKIKKGVFIIVYRIVGNRPQYLLMKRVQDWKGYEFVKGGVEPDEDFQSAAPRELKEETGIEIRLHKSKFDNEFYSEKNGQKYRHIMASYFGRINDQKITISNEHDGFEFCTLEEAVKKLPFEDQRKLLCEIDKEVRTYENL